MSTNQTKSIEKYVEDTIIEYLQSQKDLPEFSYETLSEYFEETSQQVDEVEDKQKTLFIIEELLNDILHDLDRTIDYQQHYKKTQEEHHQYALFELANYIPGFELDDHRMKELCFKESLLISDVDQPMANGSSGIKPMAVGGMCLKIEQAQGLQSHPVRTPKEMEQNILQTIQQLKKDLAQKPNDNETDEEKISKYEAFLNDSIQNSFKFVVHVSTEFDVGGSNAGSRITSWVDKDLHTLEERRTEYIKENKKSMNKQTIYFALQENKYFVKNRRQGVDPSETRKYCPFSMTKDLIGEGASLILMRYLAIIKYKGQFELSTLHINGSMCRNIYECRGPKSGMVNGYPVELCKIYRTIIEKCGIFHLSATVMTVHGMIVSHEWEGCQYIIHMNPEFVTMGRPVPYDYIALRKIWDTNMEFVSKFLDCKTEAEIKMKTYQKDHPEMHEMLTDYLQSILLLKPDNIMPFTIDYFMSYEPYNLPPLPYFDNELDRESSHQFW